MEFLHVDSGPEIEEIRRLFTEYGRSLNFDLCFQSFEQELRDLPGRYALPRGRLMLARVDGSTAGCVALKPLDADVCEMKFSRNSRELWKPGSECLVLRTDVGMTSLQYTHYVAD